jgi:hypothetical protein
MRFEIISDKDAVPLLAGHLLKRECDEVSEPAFWDRVLVREETIVRI